MPHGLRALRDGRVRLPDPLRARLAVDLDQLVPGVDGAVRPDLRVAQLDFLQPQRQDRQELRVGARRDPMASSRAVSAPNSSQARFESQSGARGDSAGAVGCPEAS